jgi:hypothetical protein
MFHSVFLLKIHRLFSTALRISSEPAAIKKQCGNTFVPVSGHPDALSVNVHIRPSGQARRSAPSNAAYAQKPLLGLQVEPLKQRFSGRQHSCPASPQLVAQWSKLQNEPLLHDCATPQHASPSAPHESVQT